MLTHLPDRTSQPSRRDYIQYIWCSFHKTTKRLSITSLTHLLRLHTTIQSSIVRHNKYVTTWLQLYDMWFCYKQKRKKKYEVSKKTFKKKHWIVSELTILVFKMTIKHNITDWSTSQKPISWRHPITLNNNITDISQKKKICLKSANDTNIYRLSLWYTTMKGWSCPFCKSNTTLH